MGLYKFPSDVLKAVSTWKSTESITGEGGEGGNGRLELWYSEIQCSQRGLCQMTFTRFRCLLKNIVATPKDIYLSSEVIFKTKGGPKGQPVSEDSKAIHGLSSERLSQAICIPLCFPV